jgi:hypothetical protein
MRGRIRVACLAAWAASAVPAPAAAWDFPGHRIVGAIADLEQIPVEFTYNLRA